MSARFRPELKALPANMECRFLLGLPAPGGPIDMNLLVTARLRRGLGTLV